jgi:hypothetical protein
MAAAMPMPARNSSIFFVCRRHIVTSPKLETQSRQIHVWATSPAFSTFDNNTTGEIFRHLGQGGVRMSVVIIPMGLWVVHPVPAECSRRVRIADTE